MRVLSAIALFVAALLAVTLRPSGADAQCASFTGSTMQVTGLEPATWRTDYPSSVTSPSSPWMTVDPKTDPQGYMAAVLQEVEIGFHRDGATLVGTGSEEWWISLWLDYTRYGREPLMGLTKERGPNPGDLSPTSTDGHQVWAVGFYNAMGATVFADIFADPCAPALPGAIGFPEGTASVKFLFTDAPPVEVPYLDGAPEYDAFIDPAGEGNSNPVDEREVRQVRLLQVDIAVKDARADATGWIFGTFGWVGPVTGDGLFDNLVPVSLQWGNDPGILDADLSETWINPDLDGVMYGWSERPTLGFNGRANGPADNIRSSCLSCHAAARIPRSPKGILGFAFDMQNDISDPAKVQQHVDVWFTNLPSGETFDPSSPAVSTLDYSLQLDAAIFRMCRACRDGEMSGATPEICAQAGHFDEAMCTGTGIIENLGIAIEDFLHDPDPPVAPRQ